MTAKICSICHTAIPSGAPGGFCPACVLRGADELVPAAPPGGPPLEEVRAAFPELDVQALIGQGGMGFVYKARQPSLDRTVALKILAPALGGDPAFAERFAREARMLGKLSHPNIVTVFEHGVTQPATPGAQPFYYLLMEYVDGVNLRQAMRAGRFTPAQALSVVPGICDALQAAHAQGIWHRDIKPENILLDARGGVKIADFGIARLVGDPQRDFTITVTGAALGSAAYMAPEQHEKPHDVDHRADIYSLGVVIYEMLTGELPLGRFPAPSQRAAVDARIDEIVLRTLEKERALRQQSAEEVKTEFTQANNNPARALPSPSRSWTPLILSQMAVVAGIVLFAGAAGLTHGSTQNALLTLSLVPFVLGLLGLFLFRRRELPRMQKRYFTRGLVAGALLAGITVAVVAIIEYQNTARALARASLAEDRAKLTVLRKAAERQAKTEPGIDWNPGASELPKPLANGDLWKWAENLKNSDMLRARGDLSGALQSCLASLVPAGKMASNEKNPRHGALADSLVKSGDLYCALGRLDDALKHYQDSISPLKKRFFGESNHLESYRKGLTQAFVKIGDVLRALGRMPEAVENYRAAVAVYRLRDSVGFAADIATYQAAISRGAKWSLGNGNTEGVSISQPLDPEALARLAAAPGSKQPSSDENRRLRQLICLASAEKATRFRYLLAQEDLREHFHLPLAGYDYSVNGNPKALDYLLTKLAAQKVGSDCDESVVLAFVDEWERSPAAVESHFTATDGTGGLNHGDFWAARMFLFPRNYLLYKIKDLEGAPLKTPEKTGSVLPAPESPPPPGGKTTGPAED